MCWGEVVTEERGTVALGHAVGTSADDALHVTKRKCLRLLLSIIYSRQPYLPLVYFERFRNFAPWLWTSRVSYYFVLSRVTNAVRV